MGQCLDLLSTNFGNKPNLQLFTMDRYNSLVKYKTAYYTFVLPTTIAMSFVSSIVLFDFIVYLMDSLKLFFIFGL